MRIPPVVLGALFLLFAVSGMFLMRQVTTMPCVSLPCIEEVSQCFVASTYDVFKV